MTIPDPREDALAKAREAIEKVIACLGTSGWTLEKSLVALAALSALPSRSESDDEKLVEAMLVAANDVLNDDDTDHAGAMLAALAVARKAPRPAPEPTAEGQEARPGWLVCSVCGDPTDMGCSDCRINYRTTVYVCGKRECRAQHERKCYGDGDLRADLARMKAAMEKCKEALQGWVSPYNGFSSTELVKRTDPATLDRIASTNRALRTLDAALKGTSS